jgi:hypothetical protein
MCPGILRAARARHNRAAMAAGGAPGSRGFPLSLAPGPSDDEPPTLPAKGATPVRLFGVTAAQFFRIGIIAVLFIVLFKVLAAKSNIAGLQAVAGAV